MPKDLKIRGGMPAPEPQLCSACLSQDPRIRIRHWIVDYQTAGEALDHVILTYPMPRDPEEWRVWWNREKTRRFAKAAEQAGEREDMRAQIQELIRGLAAKKGMPQA